MLKIAEAILWFLDLIFGGVNAEVALNQTATKYDMDVTTLQTHLERGGYYSLEENSKYKTDNQGRIILYP